MHTNQIGVSVFFPGTEKIILHIPRWMQNEMHVVMERVRYELITQ